MAIISQNSWDNLLEEEKEKIRHEYQIALTLDNYKIVRKLENLFGEENLQPKPKIKTWKDMKEEYMLHADTGTSYIIDMDKKFYSEKLALKALATLQIAKLIELGYGGMVTEEEWKQIETIPCILWDNVKNIWMIGYSRHREFIAFHSLQQAEDFMSYPENVDLIRQYYLI